MGLARVRRTTRVPAAAALLRRRGRPGARSTTRRLAARGGRLGTIDPNLYVDTSSYGPQGIDAVARVLGIDQVVHGTDRPYAGIADLRQGAAATAVIRHDNPHRLLFGAGAQLREGSAVTAQPVTDAPVVPARQASRLVELNNCLSLDNLPGRDLDPAELSELAASIAAQPHLWEDKVAYSDEERVFASLHRDANVDVWLICWTPVNDTGWHDHDVSSGAVAVARGKLVEHNLAIGTESIETEVEAGDVYGFGPDHIHRLTGLDKGSVTVHAYSPPLWRMGQYSVKDGVLRRVSVSYADELRPLD